MADRRSFLKRWALLTGAFLPTPLAKERAQAWRVFLRGPDPEVTFNTRVFDERTGEDVSRRFPIRNMRRLRRSLETGEPRLMVLYKLNEGGHIYVEGGNVAADPAWVQVVRLERTG